MVFLTHLGFFIKNYVFWEAILSIVFMLLMLSAQANAYIHSRLNIADTILNRMTVFIPSSFSDENYPAVIILPGGGYETLMIEREGSRVAQEFNKYGVVAFVLEYTLPNFSTRGVNSSFLPLMDAQNAIRYVRENAEKYKIDPQKVGVMGFSAGGHLAATLGTHYNFSLIENNKNISLRPDFMILIYPIISFADSVTHLGSRSNLVGSNFGPELRYFFSNELHVNSLTPITFLTHALDDSIVVPSNSFLFYESLKRNCVSSRLKIYSKGNHGYLHEPKFEDWFNELLRWLKKNKVLLE